MSIPQRILRPTALLLSGAAIGGAGGYAASASGASSASAKTTKAHTIKSASRRAGEARLRRAVSITAVVPHGHGSFVTVSLERGTLTSISASTLTLSEGTKRATYKTVTISLPSDAVVRLSHERSSLSQLQAGDRVQVTQGPKRTLVSARPGTPPATTE
jgi:hypothetical protein